MIKLTFLFSFLMLSGCSMSQTGFAEILVIEEAQLETSSDTAKIIWGVIISTRPSKYGDGKVDIFHTGGKIYGTKESSLVTMENVPIALPIAFEPHKFKINSGNSKIEAIGE